MNQTIWHESMVRKERSKKNNYKNMNKVTYHRSGWKIINQTPCYEKLYPSTIEAIGPK